ncbi:MAG TPA: hypothetical protein VFE72_08850 [Lysobacter sp.]|nr:hypothetical protein [Lysobacter sp.]
MAKISKATAKGLASSIGLKEQLDSGVLRFFNGPVPATADEALDMVTAHTELLPVTVGGLGTGLTFDAPNADGVLGKAAAEVWKGTVDFDGAEQAEATLAPTFYRFCAAGDNGRGAANTNTGYRLQGTAGGPNSGADFEFGVATLTNGNEQPIGSFAVALG